MGLEGETVKKAIFRTINNFFQDNDTTALEVMAADIISDIISDIIERDSEVEQLENCNN